MMNSTQQNEVNGGTPLAEPLGSRVDWQDELYADALKLVTEYRNASATFLQRRLRIGYMRADLLVKELERNGVVGPFNGTEPRKVLCANTGD